MKKKYLYLMSFCQKYVKILVIHKEFLSKSQVMDIPSDGSGMNNGMSLVKTTETHAKSVHISTACDAKVVYVWRCIYSSFPVIHKVNFVLLRSEG